MDLASEYDHRPLVPGQARAWADLMAAISVADSDDVIFGEEDLLEEFADPENDFERQSIAVYAGDVLAAYNVLYPRPLTDDVHHIRQEGGVHPDYRGRGLGSWLIAWSQRAARALHDEQHPDLPLSLDGQCLQHNAPAMDLYASLGYRQARWFHLMQCDLSGDLPPAPPPDDAEIVTFSDARSADALLVRNEAFRDHWGSTETSERSWATFTGLRVVRPDYSFLCYAGDEPIGMIICHEYEAYNETIGGRDLYIAVVGTRRAARKRGIATALLVRSLAAARADGFKSASLSVDADSPTGAVGIYERLGFAVVSTTVAHHKLLARTGSADAVGDPLENPQ